MWNSRKEDEPAPGIASNGSPTVAQLAREGIPMSTQSERSAAPAASRTVGVGKSVLIKGEVYSREDLVIDGEVEGTIKLPDHRLTVGPSGKVRAGVNAREITVLGSVNGNLNAADKIEIHKEAKVVGDITTSRIAIEDGAYCKGSVNVTRQEAAKRPEVAKAPFVPAEPVTATANIVSVN